MISTLEVSTVASCSVRCAICPQDALKAAYRKDSPHLLTLENFALALSHTPAHVRIDFSGFVEPWLNPKCTEMLGLALAHGHRVAVYTTLVGMQNPGLVAYTLWLARDRVDVVCIHEADGINMLAQDVDVDGFVAALRSPGEPALNVERMKMGGLDFEPIDRAGLVPFGRVSRHKGPIKCSVSDDYTHNVMLPNGDVHLCCQDYGLRHKIGNLITQKWEDLDRSAVVTGNASDHGGATICRRCHLAVAS